MATAPLTRLELQVKVSKILSTGFVFSIVWLGGIGSLFAFISGMWALIIIRRSKVRLNGEGLAWWCVIVGILGTIILPWGMIARFL